MDTPDIKFKKCGKCPPFLAKKCESEGKCLLGGDKKDKKPGTGNHPKKK